MRKEKKYDTWQNHGTNKDIDQETGLLEFLVPLG